MRYLNNEKYKNREGYLAYVEYCKSIWKVMPMGIKQICKGMLPNEFDSNIRYDLHDGRISKMEIDVDTIDITYLLFDEEDKKHILKGTYKDAKFLNKPSHNFIDNDFNRRCDIMCNEIIYVENGIFRHSILYPSGEELIIEFTSFELDVLYTEE